MNHNEGLYTMSSTGVADQLTAKNLVKNLQGVL